MNDEYWRKVKKGMVILAYMFAGLNLGAFILAGETINFWSSVLCFTMATITVLDVYKKLAKIIVSLKCSFKGIINTTS